MDKMFENPEAVYYCNVCTHPCFAWTGSISPNQCIRSDLDVSEKAEWNLAEQKTLNKLLHGQ